MVYEEMALSTYTGPHVGTYWLLKEQVTMGTGYYGLKQPSNRDSARAVRPLACR